jgi:hypothetical protein
VPLDAAALVVSSSIHNCPENINNVLNDFSFINFKLAINPDTFKLHLITPSGIVLHIQTKVCA